MITIEVPNLQALPQTAKVILDNLGDKKIITLSGDLGAGKTTLVKAIAKHLGVTENVSSPTYSLINEYQYGNQTLYHLDLYRLQSIDEALSIGIEEYLDSGNYCFIEWHNVIAPLLPIDVVTIAISTNPNQSRTITMIND